MTILNNLISYLRFRKARFRGCISCPDEPFFEGQESAAWFSRKLASVSTYLEYGSGGSTVLAARLQKRAYVVDSDKYFLSVVADKLFQVESSYADHIHLLYANIGLTQEWGNPVFTGKSPIRLRRWKRYFMEPWRAIDASGEVPELVLVDGRFRVCCAVISLFKLRGHDGACVIFDDYHGRPYYRVVEEFGDLVESVGRMAVFRPKSGIDGDKVSACLQEYATDWR